MMRTGGVSRPRSSGVIHERTAHSAPPSVPSASPAIAKPIVYLSWATYTPTFEPMSPSTSSGAGATRGETSASLIHNSHATPSASSETATVPSQRASTRSGSRRRRARLDVAIAPQRRGHDGRQRAVEEQGGERHGERSSPQQLDVEVLHRGDEDRADPELRAEPLAERRTEQRDRDRQAHAVEQRRHRGGGQ